MQLLLLVIAVSICVLGLVGFSMFLLDRSVNRGDG